jgi:hypothetical protein
MVTVPEKSLPSIETHPIKTRRIEIPVSPPDRILMREIADIIRGLGFRLDFWSRSRDHDEDDMEAMVDHWVDRANRDIRKAAALRDIKWRQGRPTQKEHQQWAIDAGWTGSTE